MKAPAKGGLRVDDVEVGSGATIADGDRVWMRCSIFLQGELISRTEAQEVVVRRNRLLNAVYYGLRGMRIGGTRRVIADADYTHDLRRIPFRRADGSVVEIPERSVVVFELELGEAPVEAHEER